MSWFLVYFFSPTPSSAIYSTHFLPSTPPQNLHTLDFKQSLYIFGTFTFYDSNRFSYRISFFSIFRYILPRFFYSSRLFLRRASLWLFYSRFYRPIFPFDFCVLSNIYSFDFLYFSSVLVYVFLKPQPPFCCNKGSSISVSFLFPH